MNRLMTSLTAAGLTLGLAFAALAETKSAAKPAAVGAAHGKLIFASYGCYQCHGYQGHGSIAGPKIAPNPVPFAAFEHQLRKPRDRMPVYSHVTVSEQDVRDLYAYVQSIPKAKTAAEIPLLNP